MLLLVGQEKGGVGKSTLAVNLAAMRALAGHDVLLVDTDMQQSATTWATTRTEGGVAPLITSVAKFKKIGYDLVMLRRKYESVIVDAGGRDSMELRQAMAVCDKMLAPMRPSQFDTWALTALSNLIQEVEERTGTRIPVYAALNAINTNPQITEADEMREALAEFSDCMTTLQQSIYDRIAYRRAARTGRSVVELEGREADPKAVAEMKAIYQEMFDEEWTPAAA